MMSHSHHPSAQVFDLIIIGAGISGILLAHELRAKGRQVLVIEKSRGLGGRLATRRIDAATFDHGAQFINFQSEELRDLASQLSREGLISPWIQKEGQWLHTSPGGMTKIPKFFARDLHVQLNEKVVEIRRIQSPEFEIICESGQRWSSRKVVFSSPLPQSLEILKQSNIYYPQELDSIQYAKAIVGLFQGEALARFTSEFKYQQGIDQDVLSLSQQVSKSVSSSPALTMTMAPAWSEAHFQETDQELESKLKTKFLSLAPVLLPGFKFSSFQDKLNEKVKEKVDQKLNERSNNTIDDKIDDKIDERQEASVDLSLDLILTVKKWRYSHPLNPTPTPSVLRPPDKFIILGADKKIFLMGDAFGGGSVAGAMKSALSLANYFNQF